MVAIHLEIDELVDILCLCIGILPVKSIHIKIGTNKTIGDALFERP